MIGKLSGIIDSFESDHLIMDVSGVGYLVYASSRTLSRIGQVGDVTSLLIITNVREDAITLFGFADMLENIHATLSDEELWESLHTIASNGRKMDNIIDELLLLAGVRQTKQVKINPLDMAGIVAAVLQRLADMIEEHQAEVVLPASWPMALGYGPWVEEVWVSYISNAIKHGGRPPRVELGATAEADGIVRFWVRDNGPGLAPEEQARLFAPFGRSAQMPAKGRGLGLVVVRRIMEKLGRKAAVESTGGRGSVFSFTLRGE